MADREERWDEIVEWYVSPATIIRIANKGLIQYIHESLNFNRDCCSTRQTMVINKAN